MNIITKKDIEELLKKDIRVLEVKTGDIITSEAQDFCKKNSVQIDYSDTPQKNFACKTSPKSFGEVLKPVDLSKDQALSLYERMLKIRIFEEFAKSFKEKGIIPGDFVHLYLGEEAIAAGVCAAITDNDYITSTHRGHGHMIAKGADTKKMFAELLGKETGYCRGKGGSMHISDIDIGILGANGIVGAGLPIACGSALVSKFEDDRKVTVSFFGDGATNQGTFSESLNFAKVFSLPVLFVCENNGYAISTPISYGCSDPELTKRAAGYGIESVSINGDDVFEVYAAAKHYIDIIRDDPRPVFIETLTHRHVGHWVGDPQNYRSSAEMEALPEYDPLKVYLQKIKPRGDISNQELDEMEKTILKEIQEAAMFAQDSPYPPGEISDKDYLKEEL